MTKKINLMLIGIIASGLAWGFAAMGQDTPVGIPDMPPPRAIPAITTDDQFPAGCVDCHLNYTDMSMDTRLSTVVASWAESVDPEILEIAQSLVPPEQTLAGAHPQFDFADKPIPGACLDCHESGSGKTMPLVPFLHKVHLGEVGESVFLRMFQGECTHCHKLDKTTGEWSIPSAKEPEVIVVK